MIKCVTVLGADGTGTILYYTDTAFAINPTNVRSQTSSVFNRGKGEIANSNLKQKINTRSSDKGELNVVDDRFQQLSR